MSKKFYLIYQLVLIILTIAAVVLGIISIISNMGHALIQKTYIWEQPTMIICIAIFGFVLLAYGVFILLTYIKGEKIS